MKRSLFWVVLFLLSSAGSATAHGPTIRIGAEGLDPTELVLERGERVHFHNRDAVSHRVRGDDGAFRSPELAPGEGWHLPFPFPGRFGFELEARPDARGLIVVGDPDPEP